jgi:hypothetical protein
MPDQQTNMQLDAARARLEDRRRPNRVRVVSTELLHLLRDDAKSATETQASALGAAPTADDPPKGHGDPIKGIVIAIAVAIPVWVLIVLGVLFFVVPGYR